MSMATVKKAENQLNVTFLFEIGKLASLLSLIGSIVMYVMNIFTSITLPAALLFLFLTFLAGQSGKKEKRSEALTSTLIVANATYIVTIAFLFGRMFVR